ncbi:MAG: MoaD/ThiS family protein [Bacillota bacterium]
MRVKLRNYGYYADLLGGPLVELEIPGSTLGDLFTAIRSRFGVDLGARPNLRLIVGEKVLHSFPAGFRLEEGAEVAIVPVVAGGDWVVREEVSMGRRSVVSRHRGTAIRSARGEERECTGGYSSPG